MNYTLIDEKTGSVLRKRRKPDKDGLPELRPGQTYMIGHYIHEATQLYRDGKIIAKPESKTTLTGTKLENLPKPTTVTITGNGATFRRIITDGTYEFSIDVPGRYTVKCESKVELPIEFEVAI